MDSIHTFFLVNRQLILFVYGLSFFVLGLAIALQTRQYSRLDLARSLPWLAAFGFAHALNEWGDLFIPLQTAYLGESASVVLYTIQCFLLALSFAFLFEFGVLLLRPTGLARLLHGGALGLMAVWLAVSLAFFLPAAPTMPMVWREADALSRYMIGLPGALLAAWGLRRQALQRIAPLNVPHVLRMLRVAGVALAFYAIFAGLVVPPVAFFPGNILNAQTFQATLGVPPSVFRSLIGLTLAIAMIRALDIFDLETQRFIEQIEQQQILKAERDRIARDLHDGVIQKVYTAGLLIDSARQHCASQDTVGVRLERAAAALNDAMVDLRHNLGVLRVEKSDSSLAETLHRLARDPRFQPLVEISLDLDLPADDALPASRVDQIVAIVHEALSNVVRHARARRVEIQARREADRFKLVVQDDGIGLPRPLTTGYGLRNIRDRAHLLGGQVEIADARVKGTVVRLDVPWRDEP
ncbi:MAG: ATP-binding protein [Chloroflexi bacterium]|nr:ATP-binding protein [Chloroflexota bacterium]